HTSYRCTVTSLLSLSFFSFTDPAPTEIYTLSLHDALPISQSSSWWRELSYSGRVGMTDKEGYYQQRYTAANAAYGMSTQDGAILDRKSTRLNSSHVKISYAVFCLKKKSKTHQATTSTTTAH